MTSDWRKKRIAKNETRFRDINERLEKGLQQVRHTPELLQFVCECGSRDCEELVTLSFQEYEEVRADSRHFAVVPGHVFEETEHVVRGTDRFEVVEKEGACVEVTDAADNRAPGAEGLREASSGS